jgi:hypothetical protein
MITSESNTRRLFPESLKPVVLPQTAYYTEVWGRSFLSFQIPMAESSASVRFTALSRNFSRTALRTSSETVQPDCRAWICNAFQTSSSIKLGSFHDAYYTSSVTQRDACCSR